MISQEQFVEWITNRCVKRLSSKKKFVVRGMNGDLTYTLDENIVRVTVVKVLDDEYHPMGLYNVNIKTYDLDNWSIIDNKMVADHDVMPL